MKRRLDEQQRPRDHPGVVTEQETTHRGDQRKHEQERLRFATRLVNEPAHLSPPHDLDDGPRWWGASRKRRRPPLPALGRLLTHSARRRQHPGPRRRKTGHDELHRRSPRVRRGAGAASAQRAQIALRGNKRTAHIAGQRLLFHQRARSRKPRAIDRSPDMPWASPPWNAYVTATSGEAEFEPDDPGHQFRTLGKADRQVLYSRGRRYSLNRQR
jgi:hypothetical protein